MTRDPYLCAAAVAEIASVATDEEKLSPTYWAMKAAEKGAEVFMPSEVALDRHEKPGYDPNKTRHATAAKEFEKLGGDLSRIPKDYYGDRPIYDRDKLRQDLEAAAKPKSGQEDRGQFLTDYEIEGPDITDARRGAIQGYESDKIQQSVYKPGVLPSEKRYREKDIEDIQNILKSQNAQSRPMSEGIKSEMDMQQIIKEEFEKLMLDEGKFDWLTKLFRKKPKPVIKPGARRAAGETGSDALKLHKKNVTDLEKEIGEMKDAYGAPGDVPYKDKPLTAERIEQAEEKLYKLRNKLPVAKTPAASRVDGGFDIAKAEKRYLTDDALDRARGRTAPRTKVTGKRMVDPRSHIEKEIPARQADLDRLKDLEDLADARARNRDYRPGHDLHVDDATYHSKLQRFDTLEKARKAAALKSGLKKAAITGVVGTGLGVGGVALKGALAGSEAAQIAADCAGVDYGKSTKCDAAFDDMELDEEDPEEREKRVQDFGKVHELELKEAIKRMVIEALKKQKVNEQPLTPTGLPPKPDTMDVKVDMDPDPRPAEAPPAERLTPSEKEDMEMSEDIEFESAQDLKEKIAEEKFNKLVNAIAKK